MDIDGNLYHTVQIGTQCWTQSNLKVSKYRNGDSIPTALSNSAWQSTSSGAYTIYDNNPVNDGLYGKLYNHYAVVDNRGLCPTGWHVPTDGEWNVMVKYLDPYADTGTIGWQNTTAGGALKSTTTQPTSGGWNSPNSGATNSSGFSAGPGGLRASHDGSFYFLGIYGVWWTSSNTWPYSNYAWARYLYHGPESIYRGYDGHPSAFSVRCLKNTLPQVNTNPVSNVTTTTVMASGEVISEGAQNTVRGFCYATISNPTLSNDTTVNGTGLGAYSGTLQNLTPSTTYYVRAYATNSVGTAYGNEVTFTTPLLSIGMSYAGGIVFDLDSSGQHGLVCAPSDQGAYPWGCYGTDIPNTSTAVGTGATSTANIVAGCAQRPIAASVCADLVLNGYSDWYLPSLGELQLMYSRLHLQGLGGFGWDWYWSSSQYGPYSAWAMDFYGGNVVYSYGKGYNVQVRAVRSF